MERGENGWETLLRLGNAIYAVHVESEEVDLTKVSNLRENWGEQG